MARTVRIKVYKFHELDERAKEKAIDWFYSVGGNTDHDWWGPIYEDAANVGIELTEFDLGRGNICKGLFTEDACYTANKIKEEHGEETATYKTAVMFLAERDEIVNTAPKDENGEWEDEYELDAKIDECEE